MILVKQIEGIWQRWIGESNLSLRKVSQLITDGVWTEDDYYVNHGIQIAEPFVVPEGERIVDNTETFEEIEGVVHQVHITEAIPVPEPPPPPTKSELKEYTTEKRKSIISGAALISVANTDIPVWVDAESRGSMTGLVVATTMNPALETLWLGADGNFYPMNANSIIEMSVGVMTYVQTAFGVQQAVYDGIDANTITSYETIDNVPQWPVPYDLNS